MIGGTSYPRVGVPRLCGVLFAVPAQIATHTTPPSEYTQRYRSEHSVHCIAATFARVLSVASVFLTTQTSQWVYEDRK